MSRLSRLIPVLLAALVLAVGLAGCDSFEEINTDPNNPNDVPENLRLTGILSNFSYQVVGGEAARAPNFWVQQLAFNGTQPSLDTYDHDESDVDNLWRFMSYTDVMYNAVLLDEQATANGNFEYAGIAKTMLAWNLMIVTDLWGDVPYSEAFQVVDGRILDTTPAYDEQEAVYASIIELLTQAKADFGRELDPDRPNLRSPGADDLVYTGNMDAWSRLTSTLLARAHLHLTNAPGNDAAERAGLALDALDDGFQSLADDATFTYVDASGSENPWFQWTIDSKWDTRYQLSEQYVGLLKTNQDPRLFVQARQVGAVNGLGLVAGFQPVPPTDAMFDPSDGTYVGHTNGAEGIGTSSVSSIGTFYSAADAPLTWLSYVEAAFIRAEAVLRTQGAAAADPLYRDAIRASMDQLGVSTSDRDDYVGARPSLTAVADPLEAIILEKYVALYLQPEPYNDWRRTGYPELSPVTNSPRGPGNIPLRYTYPISELSNNPDNVEATGIPAGFAAFGEPVWWDGG